ncbi:efflux RND transporter periplasmic adaptor subunit [Sediminicola luteus]|uniref:Multidrug resistance protein MdtA-like C-terminal permuted SH3 domain-containing protein n=1 Tax=Sediminicola luteus TaxID=319238 RepID=A0A2A4G4Y9_9FLAO|nr:RND transporter [Sediminicola luteus]PCE62795.1 hypothetical protein B7P33_16050 [Sediminicola luteus]
MDKIVERKKSPYKKPLLFGGIGAVVLALIVMAAGQKNSLNIKKDRVTIKSVSYDTFEDMALFNALVEPLNTIQINTLESGTVKRIHTENGKRVEKGEVLLELYNPNTELNYLTQETAIIEQINNLRNTRIAIKNQQMVLDRDLIKMSYEYNNAERQFRMDTTLYRKGVISKNDYLKSKETFDFQTKQQSNTKAHVKKEQQDRDTQLRLINTSIARMEQSLEQLRANKENFIIKAPEAGLLSSYSPVLGESYGKGQLIGKIDMLNGYKLVAQADEFYFNALAEGQEALLEHEGALHKLKVNRVIAEVINGKFEVELVFDGEIPKSIRRGMNLPIKIYQSSNNKKALLLPQGGFYQSSGGQYVFVLTDEGTAEKRAISLGKKNPYYYEVLEGLQEGDRVITSTYADFKEKETINLNE